MTRIDTVALAAILCCSASAADFYVATNGRDAASGAQDSPFASLDRARAAVRALRQSGSGRTTPIVVTLRGGTYFLSSPLNFTAADSGSAQTPVIYQAYPGETPVISGGRQVTGWKQDPQTKHWVASLPPNFRYFEQLYVNGQRRFRPRTTKEGYLYNEGSVNTDAQSPACPAGSPAQGYRCYDRFKFKAGDLEANYHNITDVEIDNFEIWTMSKLRLKSVDTQNHIAYLTGWAARNPDSGFLTGHRYLVENVREALSQPGEWYLDRGVTPWTLTYIPQSGENMAATTVIAPQLAQVLVADALSYVTFKGITFSHDNWVVPDIGHESYQDEPRVGAAVSFTKASYVVLDSCVVAHTGGWGLEFIGTGPFTATPVNQVINSALYDLGAGGLRIGAWPKRDDTDESVGGYALVQNNVVSGGGRILPAGIGTGIWIGNSHNNTVSHNDVYDFYSGAIGVCVPLPLTCPLPHDNLVEFNHVYQLGQGVTSDFGGIYVATYNAPNNRVMNNKVHDVTHYYKGDRGNGAEGIYIDNITSNVKVQNNLVYRVSLSTAMNNRGINNTWLNNIFAYGGAGMVQRGPRDDPDGLSFNFTNNIVYFARSPIQMHPPEHMMQAPPAARARMRQFNMWTCAKNDGTPVPCTERYKFDSNLYWNPLGKPPVFVTATPDNPIHMVNHSFSEWQALGQDVNSFNLDPLFVNPSYPADDFRLKPGSPASKIGFVPFDASQAGRTHPVLRPPPVPQAFPLLLMDPVKDYGQSR